MKIQKNCNKPIIWELKEVPSAQTQNKCKKRNKETKELQQTYDMRTQRGLLPTSRGGKCQHGSWVAWQGMKYLLIFAEIKSDQTCHPKNRNSNQIKLATPMIGNRVKSGLPPW